MPSKRRIASGKPKGSRAASALLIIRGDIATLQRQGLSLDGPHSLARVVTQIGINADVESVDVTDKHSLLGRIEAFGRERRTFKVVVIVAHGDAHGVCIASDLYTTWEGLSAYLKPIRAGRVLLIACQSGRYDGVNKLFGGVPSLRRVFASPLDVDRKTAELLLLLVPYLVANRSPAFSRVRRAQLADASGDAMSGLAVDAQPRLQQPFWSRVRSHCRTSALDPSVDELHRIRRIRQETNDVGRDGLQHPKVLTVRRRNRHACT